MRWLLSGRLWCGGGRRVLMRWEVGLLGRMGGLRPAVVLWGGWCPGRSLLCGGTLDCWRIDLGFAY